MTPARRPNLVRAALLSGALLAVLPASANALETLVPVPGSPFGLPGGSLDGQLVHEGNPAVLGLFDANGDGRPDAVTLNGNGTQLTVGVLPGDGRGGFGTATLSPVGGGTTWLIGGAVADVDGDGRRDLVFGYGDPGGDGASGFGVMRGRGDGRFAPVSWTPVTSGSFSDITSLAVGDLDRDGKLDVVVVTAQRQAAHVVRRFRGDGAGGFTPLGAPTPLKQAPDDDLGSYPQSVSVADVTEDGKPDVLVTRIRMPGAAPATVGVSVLRGDGLGGIAELPTSPFSTGGPGAAGGGGVNATHLRIADLDGDGHRDLVTINKHAPTTGGIDPNPAGATVSVLRGDGQGRFAPAPGSPFPVYAADAFEPDPFPLDVTVDDLDGDGHPDLAVANERDGRLVVLGGRGDGGFTLRPALSRPLPTDARGPFLLDAADLDGDGRADLALAHQLGNRTRISVWRNPAPAKPPVTEEPTDPGDGGTTTPGGPTAPGDAATGPAPVPPAPNPPAAPGPGSVRPPGTQATGLVVRVRTATVRAARGGRARFALTVRNPGRASVRGARLCVVVPKRQLRGPGCVRLATIGAGRTLTRTLVLRVRPAATRGKPASARVTVSASGVSARTSLRVRVR